MRLHSRVRTNSLAARLYRSYGRTSHTSHNDHQSLVSCKQDRRVSFVGGKAIHAMTSQVTLLSIVRLIPAEGLAAKKGWLASARGSYTTIRARSSYKTEKRNRLASLSRASHHVVPDTNCSVAPTRHDMCKVRAELESRAG